MKKLMTVLVAVFVAAVWVLVGATWAWWRTYCFGHDVYPDKIATRVELDNRLPWYVSQVEISPVKTSYWTFVSSDKMIEYGVARRPAFHVAYSKDDKVKVIIPISE